MSPSISIVFLLFDRAVPAEPFDCLWIDAEVAQRLLAVLTKCRRRHTHRMSHHRLDPDRVRQLTQRAEPGMLYCFLELEVLDLRILEDSPPTLSIEPDGRPSLTSSSNHSIRGRAEKPRTGGDFEP